MNVKVVLSYEELRKILTSIPDLRHQAFLCLTYASFGRVGEVVWHRFDKRDNPLDQQNPPLHKNDLKEKNGLLVIQIKTEKTGRKRLTPLNMQFEAWLVNPILAYAKTVDGFLFPYSTRWGEKVFEKYFGKFCRQHIHHLRAWRATHALQGKTTPNGQPLHPNIVARMGGWTDLKALSAIYDQSVIEDYEHLLQPEKKKTIDLDILYGDGI